MNKAPKIKIAKTKKHNSNQVVLFCYAASSANL